MNLAEFLSQVNDKAQAMNPDQRLELILELARVHPEMRRQEYLDRMNQCASDKESTVEVSTQSQQESLKSAIKDLKKELSKIESGEYSVDSEYNDYYNEWSDSDDEDEIIYLDPMGIGGLLDTSAVLIHKCVDGDLAREGYNLFKKILGLNILIEGEACEFADIYFSVKDLVDIGLFEINYNRLITEGLYLTYRASALKSRSQAIMDMLMLSKLPEVSLEAVMQCGGNLKDIKDFLPLWMKFLAERSDNVAWLLLKESTGLINDLSMALAFTREHVGAHPGLYHALLKSYDHSMTLENVMDIGKEGLEAIPHPYYMRSRVASRMLRAIDEKAGVTEAYKPLISSLRIERFRSDSVLQNFLPILMDEGENPEVMELVGDINHAVKDHSKFQQQAAHHKVEDHKLNSMIPNHHYLIALLQGEYRYVRSEAMMVQGNLGWSDSFMKTGLAAFLLMLTRSKTLGPGGQNMLKRVNAAVQLYRCNPLGDFELLLADIEITMDTLLDAFEKAKVNHPLNEEMNEFYVTWIKALIERRVAGIMEGNHRRFYDECAAYIAAYGEAIESHGHPGAKEQIMQYYRSKYSRRSAFHSELRTFGMKELKKKN